MLWGLSFLFIDSLYIFLFLCSIMNKKDDGGWAMESYMLLEEPPMFSVFYFTYFFYYVGDFYLSINKC